MTNIEFYQASARRRGNEAVDITASASPSEVLDCNSISGGLLSRSAEVLGLDEYPSRSAILTVEGRTSSIIENADRLHRLAPQLARRAINEASYGGAYSNESPASLAETLQTVSAQAAAKLRKAENPTLMTGVVDLYGPFAEGSTWDGCFVRQYDRPYEPPTDHRITNILREQRSKRLEEYGHVAGQRLELDETEVSPFLLDGDEMRVAKLLALYDNLPPQDELAVAWEYYVRERQRDPNFIANLDRRLRMRKLQAEKPVQPSGEEKKRSVNMSLKLDGDQFGKLIDLARVHGITMGEQMRSLLSAHIDESWNDPEFLERLQQAHKAIEPLLPPIET